MYTFGLVNFVKGIFQKRATVTDFVVARLAGVEMTEGSIIEGCEIFNAYRARTANGKRTLAVELPEGVKAKVWLADEQRWVEAGPGRGTLMADILRTADKVAPDFVAAADIHLMEISPALTEKQAAALAGRDPVWIDGQSC